MASENKIGLKGILIFIVILIGIPFFIILVELEAMDYRVNGVEVTATVIDVYEQQSIRRGRPSQTKVIVTYEDQYGKLFRATTKNPGSYVIGESFVGKIVPNKPNIVYRAGETSKESRIIMFSILGAVYLLTIIFLFLILRRKSADKKLAVKGEVAEAEVIRCDTYGNETFVDVRFKDETGLLYNASCVAPPDMNLVAKTCFVRYVVTSENSVDCEIISHKKR